MKLQVGERLEGAGPAHQPGGYVVTSIVRETPWHGLYAGRKIYYNFDFTAKRVRETDEVEWLDVFIRTIRYPILDDAGYVQQRRALARAEMRAVLGNRGSNLWPEPLDLLEIENSRDRFSFTGDAQRGGEPIAVYARPHGKFTFEWQQQMLPSASIFSVLAELLEFLRQAHAESLLLLGLGPTSLLIDESDRVHYVGTEMVLPQHSPLLGGGTPATTWQRLFPGDRFTRGYSAPECFDPNRRPDPRTDLYSWGTLAFGLLSGADLIKQSHEQGKPWITFNDAHFTQLERALTPLARNAVVAWAQQIGIDPAGVLRDWPRNFVAVFRLLLSVEPSRRPRSVDELLRWLIHPPPPPIAALIALHTDGDNGKLLFDCTGVDPGMEMLVQRTRNAPAERPSDGTTVAEGAIRPVIGVSQLSVSSGPVYFTAFTRRRQGGVVAFSPGVVAQLWQPNAQKLREWVEEQAAGAFDSLHIPTRVGMVLSALDVQTTTESLILSPNPRVRAWGLRRIEQTLRSQGRTDAIESLLWRYFGDRNVEVRQSAVATFWTFHPHKTDAVLLRLVEALEAPPIDAPIPVLHFLRQLQLPEDRIRGVLAQWESRRPMVCPLCNKPLSMGERGGHLQKEHGYLFYQGDLMPASAVFTHLWDRAFEQQDRHAHEELVGMYLNLPEARGNPAAAAHRYVADLERVLLGDAKPGGTNIPVAIPYASLLAYQTNLRVSRLFVPIVQQLLRSQHRRLRDLGFETAVPYVLEHLPPRAGVGDLHRMVGGLCGGHETIDVQIELCRRLAQYGVDQTIVGGCIAQLQEERLVVCSECKANVQMRDLEIHLRRAHRIYQFRGVRNTYVDVRESMLRAICNPPVDVAAWRSLEQLAEDKHPGEADRFLVAWLYQVIKEATVEQRPTIVGAIADVVTAAGAAERLLPIFVGPSKNASWELLGQHIALELGTRVPMVLSPRLQPMILPLMDNKELPRRTRENAALAMLRYVGKDQALAVGVVRAFVAQSSKKRGLEKLQSLEQRFGHSPAIDQVSQELDSEIRMSCPRCAVELKKKDMVPHLWNEHHLVLDGERVREPWRVIEDWVVDYGLEKEPQVLQRCRDLAARDDPQNGPAKLQRMLYQRGIRDPALVQEMRATVKSRKVTLCPHCCSSVPIPPRPEIERLTLTDSKLEGFGYVVEVSENGLVPTLVLESPDAIIFRAWEPGRGLTRMGGMFVLVLPVMVGLFIGLSIFMAHELPPALIATASVGVGMLWASFLFVVWPSPGAVRERLLNAAWDLLVPAVLRDKKKGRKAWSFLYALVEFCEGLTDIKLNADMLLDCCEKASEAAKGDPFAALCLARLSQRYLAEVRETGEDFDHFLTTLAAECFKGKLPLSFLSDLVANFHAAEQSNWKKSDLNRIPILIAHQAFLADVDVEDWLSLGRAFPVLGSVLNLEGRAHWQRFFAIWHGRNRKSWKDVGPALLMLDLAASPADHDELLSHYPDVLLYVRKANLVIGTRGIWIEGVCVTSYRPGTTIASDRGSNAYELRIGDVRIRCTDDPRPYLEDIKRWLRWYFFDFLPTVPAGPRPQTESRHRMWQLDKTACNDCSRPLVPCPADIGVPVK